MRQISDSVMSSLMQLSCEDVAVRLGITVKRHQALCFMHDDHHPSLHFLGERRNRWYCFVCCKGGNAIELVREYAGCTFIDACNWLCEQFCINTDGPLPRVELKCVKSFSKLSFDKDENLFARNIAQFILDNSSLTDIGSEFLFDKRKLNPDIIKALNIISIDNQDEIISKLSDTFSDSTLSSSGFVKIRNGVMFLRLFTPCLVFPYYDINGELIGLQSRYLGSKKNAPRFQFMSSQKTHLFNMQILKTLRQNDDLYISEGITDCLAMLSSGKKAVAIPSATNIPLNDLSLLVEYKLHMYPDQDEAGIKAFIELQQFFISALNFLKAERLPEGVNDYGDYYVMQHGK